MNDASEDIIHAPLLMPALLCFWIPKPCKESGMVLKLIRATITDLWPHWSRWFRWRTIELRCVLRVRVGSIHWLCVGPLQLLWKAWWVIWAVFKMVYGFGIRAQVLTLTMMLNIHGFGTDLFWHISHNGFYLWDFSLCWHMKLLFND